LQFLANFYKKLCGLFFVTELVYIRIENEIDIYLKFEKEKCNEQMYNN